jgi:hypothetical protein
MVKSCYTINDENVIPFPLVVKHKAGSPTIQNGDVNHVTYTNQSRTFRKSCAWRLLIFALPGFDEISNRFGFWQR